MNTKKVSPSIKVIIKHDKKILLQRHKDGTYDIPGGRVEYGESCFEALNRELNEELGFTIKNLQDLTLFHNWHYVSKSRNLHYVYVVYLCEIKNPPKFTHQEGGEIIWVDKRELSGLHLLPEFKEMLLRSFDE